MIVLTIRTDKPEAEIGLYDNQKQLAYTKWQAHLELSRSIHKEIEKILISVKPSRLDLSSEAAKISGSRKRYKLSISWDGVDGIVCYKGPGSFTGLRIGLSVANALAYAQRIPIVATSGEDWTTDGIKQLLAGQNDKTALPKYDRPAATTPPKK